MLMTEDDSGTNGSLTLRSQRAIPHLIVLGYCSALLLAAILLARVDAGKEHLQIGAYPLPSICAFKNAFGLPCPGCGLTRSWVAIARGELDRSLTFHRLGWLIMIYALLQAVRHTVWLVTPAAQRMVEQTGRWLDRALVLIALLLLANWIVILR
jgi:hypothetical protein